MPIELLGISEAEKSQRIVSDLSKPIRAKASTGDGQLLLESIRDDVGPVTICSKPTMAALNVKVCGIQYDAGDPLHWAGLEMTVGDLEFGIRAMNAFNIPMPLARLSWQAILYSPNGSESNELGHRWNCVKGNVYTGLDGRGVIRLNHIERPFSFNDPSGLKYGFGWLQIQSNRFGFQIKRNSGESESPLPLFMNMDSSQRDRVALSRNHGPLCL